MPVGLVVPTLQLSIKVALAIIIVTSIVTRSVKLLLIGSSLFLLCCLFALAQYLYKHKVTAPAPVTSAEQDEEVSEEEEQVQGCPCE